LRDYKRPDLAVEACLKINRNLVVVGNGKMRETLAHRVAGRSNVVFLGRVTDDDLRGVYANARALLFPGVEDFGIVPVEAQSAGLPVIARGAGGARETVVDETTGCFFKEDTVSSLCAAVEYFESRDWFAKKCRENAALFSKSVFIERMKKVLYE
jgi:glycosyltransferase involved in cell wall biosynthesis